eukprot:3086250-Rhodomonas_salina.1
MLALRTLLTQVEDGARAIGAARKRAREREVRQRAQEGSAEASLMELWLAGKLSRQHLKVYDASGAVIGIAALEAVDSCGRDDGHVAEKNGAEDGGAQDARVQEAERKQKGLEGAARIEDHGGRGELGRTGTVRELID